MIPSGSLTAKRLCDLVRRSAALTEQEKRLYLAALKQWGGGEMLSWQSLQVVCQGLLERHHRPSPRA